MTLNRPWTNIVVWHHSLLLMNGYNKTEAAVFSCRLCFLRAFPFISLIGTAHRVIIANISGKLFVNPTRGSKDKEWTQNTVIQRLILNFDLDLQLTLVKQHCTSSHYSWHLCKVICKYHQGFKRYRTDTKYKHTMLNLKLWPWPWTDLGQT